MTTTKYSARTQWRDQHNRWWDCGDELSGDDLPTDAERDAFMDAHMAGPITDWRRIDVETGDTRVKAWRVIWTDSDDSIVASVERPQPSLLLTLAFAGKGDNDNGPEPFFDVWADGDDHSGLSWVDGVHGVVDVEIACERLGIDPTALVDITDQYPSKPYTKAWRFPAEALR